VADLVWFCGVCYSHRQCAEVRCRDLSHEHQLSKLAEFDEDRATWALVSVKALRELTIHKRSTVSSCEPSSKLCSVTEFVILTNPSLGVIVN
jgi:hypothetical protein